MEDNRLETVDEELLNEISDYNGEFKGAYNIRKNGKGIQRKVTENINIVTKTDKPGIDIIVKPNTKFEFVHIPVILTESGLKDVVYNDFFIGKDANVIIIAGCGIHNDHHKNSQHDGIHRFFLEEGAKVKAYVFFKGRSILFKEQGEVLLLRFANDLEEYGKVEQLPVLEGKRMIIMLTPKKAGAAATSKPAVSKPVVKKVVVTPKPKTEESE